MILLSVVVFFWGISWYAIAMQLGEVHPLVSIAWRFFIASIVLSGWLILSRQFRLPARADATRLLGLGVCLFCLNFVCFYLATGYITSGLISVVFAAAVFITFVNQWIWAGIRPQKKTLLGAVFGLAGIAVLFLPSISDDLARGDRNSLLGFCLSVLGTWFFSVGNLVSASLPRTTHLPSAIACGMLIGALCSALIATLLGESLVLPKDIAYLSALAYLAIGASVIGFVAYLTLVAKEGAAKAGYATVLFPILALAVSTVMEGYVWTLLAASGVLLATTGALIVFYPERSKAL